MLTEKLKDLIEREGPVRVMEAVREVLARDMDRRRACYRTGRPLHSPVQCLYCRRDCVLAGYEMQWREA